MRYDLHCTLLSLFHAIEALNEYLEFLEIKALSDSYILSNRQYLGGFVNTVSKITAESAYSYFSRCKHRKVNTRIRYAGYLKGFLEYVGLSFDISINRPKLLPDFVYIASDGNMWAGDTVWHSDDDIRPGYKRVKIAFYLDSLTEENGCLRVIPGSHRHPLHKDLNLANEEDSDAPFGISNEELPSFPIETYPGDVPMFCHDIWYLLLAHLICVAKSL